MTTVLLRPETEIQRGLAFAADVCTVKSRNKLLSLLRTGMITLLRRIPAVFVTCTCNVVVMELSATTIFCPRRPFRSNRFATTRLSFHHQGSSCSRPSLGSLGNQRSAYYQMMEGAIVFHQYRKLKEEDLAATLKLLKADTRPKQINEALRDTEGKKSRTSKKSG